MNVVVRGVLHALAKSTRDGKINQHAQHVQHQTSKVQAILNSPPYCAALQQVNRNQFRFFHESLGKDHLESKNMLLFKLKDHTGHFLCKQH